ncbi:N-acyl-phosphatidylethanolamine-hydrolyzing phospholipase D-like [Paramuricea clavata]|uniref:N-acetylphosphatidylethanolamine-hydrolyzing phospholipase D n=1 Tax=Paramuricea clavata TaxID=317549 RepID=A0A7D9EKU4_PARCT|nr:N-acyl-phosphatidylethanolamine-hydrolyzing phospholipase D-like [Paramuricea clavata]
MAEAQSDRMIYTQSIKVGSTYKNPWGDGDIPSKRAAIYFLTESNLSNVPGEEELNKTLPVHKLCPEVSRPPDKGIRITWIGHASVLVQFDGYSILADPIFSYRCSPLSFAGPKRYRPSPCTVDELPNIDAVCISHNHYDHLDVQTVQDLNVRFPNINWFVPAGLKDWMSQTGVTKNVSEYEWWGEKEISKTANDKTTIMKFVFTPTKHWCNRGVFDRNRVLWGSWTMIGPRYRVYFGGDTAYCKGFKEIGHKYGPFDLAAIPIGAYEPRKTMEKQHVNPEEAVKIHQDVKAKKSLGIHWGTFVLTYEYYLDPPKKLKEALLAAGIPEEDFFTLDHGESRLIIPDPEMTPRL